jgi:hypothetical protein
MAIMRTNRLTSKTTVKERRIIPASELEAQDAAFKSERDRYEAQVSRYKNTQKTDRSYATFGGGAIDVSPAGLAEYNKSYRDYDEPEATRIERPRSFGSEAEYLKKVGKDKSVYVGHVTYKEPAKPTAQKADWSKVELTTVAAKKPTIKNNPVKLKQLSEKEPLPDFVAPGVQKNNGIKKSTRTVTKGALNKSYHGPAEKGQAKLKGARVTTTETEARGKNRDMMGYNRKEKQFKAYAGTSVLGESHIGKSAQDLNAYKKEYQSQRKAYRKEGNIEGVAATGMEVKQARQAEKFVKGNQAHFNTRNREKTTGIKSAIALDYRDSAQNAANRNTMQAKLNAISAKPKNRTNMY